MSFDVIVTGIRERLRVADVMINQLEISNHPMITQRVMFAAPSYPDEERSGSIYHDNDKGKKTRICVANLEEGVARMEKGKEKKINKEFEKKKLYLFNSLQELNASMDNEITYGEKDDGTTYMLCTIPGHGNDCICAG